MFSIMRLSQDQAGAIRRVVQAALGADSEVWLFGSRSDDAKRGGDVDLYVETRNTCTLRQKLRLMTKIQLLVGLRKVDLIVKSDGMPERPIFATAKSEGVRL